MARVAWIEILDRHGDVAQRHPVDGWPVRIGRGYDCDVVLDDPYVAPDHLRIEPHEPHEAERYRLDGTGSNNGIQVNRQRARCEAAVVGPDDVLRIGHTQLRIRPLDHPVAAERPLTEGLWWRSWRGLLLALACFGLVEFALLWLGYNRDEGYSILVQPFFGLIPAFLMWIGFWALLGRVFAGAANFLAHAVIAVLGTTAVMLLESQFYHYVGFALDAGQFFAAASGVLGPLVFGLVLYRHIGLVSRIGKRVLAWGLAGLMLSLVGLIHLDELWTADKHMTRMEYVRTIGPPALLLRSGQSLEDFMTEAQQLPTRLEP